jgi:hypothetical protein
MSLTRTVRSVALALAVVALAACTAVTGPRSFSFSAVTTAGASWMVVVNDTSGRIQDMKVDPNPPIADATGRPFNPPGSPDVLVVPWVGGACDTRTTFTVAAGDDGRIEISYQVDVAPGDCEDLGVSHQLVLRTSPVVPAANVMMAVPGQAGG